MIGLDTNVLVRYLTQDDAAQARKADALIGGAVARGATILTQAGKLLHGVLHSGGRKLTPAYLLAPVEPVPFAGDEQDGHRDATVLRPVQQLVAVVRRLRGLRIGFRGGRHLVPRRPRLRQGVRARQ